MNTDCSIPLKFDLKILKHKSKNEVDLILPTKCKKCPFEAISKLLFLRHFTLRSKTCRNNKVYSDGFYRLFLSESHLRKYIHTTQAAILNKGEGFYKCLYCSYKTQMRRCVLAHLKEQHASEEEKKQTWFKCKYCDYRTMIRVRMDYHELRKHADEKDIKWLRCNNCSYQTKVKFNLGNHIRKRHLADYVVECEICLLPVQYTDLKQHMADDHVDSGLTCDICKQTFTFKSNLDRHIQRIHNTFYYYCPCCDFKSTVQRQLREHIFGNHTQEEARWYQCAKCPYKALAEANIKRHMMIVHSSNEQITWFKCLSCDFKTKTKSQLKLHTNRMHVTDKERAKKLRNPYKCDMCGRSYTSPSALFTHKCHKTLKSRAAPEEREYQCEFCGYRLRSQFGMQMHIMKQHKPEEVKYFQCDSCEFKTPTKGQLKLHILRKHTKDEDIAWLKCGYCSYKCKLRMDLKSHLTRKHNKSIMEHTQQFG